MALLRVSALFLLLIAQLIWGNATSVKLASIELIVVWTSSRTA